MAALTLRLMMIAVKAASTLRLRMCGGIIRSLSMHGGVVVLGAAAPMRAPSPMRTVLLAALLAGTWSMASGLALLT